MAEKHAGPTPRPPASDGPTLFPAWRGEFLTRSSWGTHPGAYHAAKPQREYHIDDKGPCLKQGHHVEDHPGDA